MYGESVGQKGADPADTHSTPVTANAEDATLIPPSVPRVTVISAWGVGGGGKVRARALAAGRPQKRVTANLVECLGDVKVQRPIILVLADGPAGHNRREHLV